MDYVTGYELDQTYRWPYGRAERMARKGQLPHYTLPDGSLRFVRSEVEDLIEHAATVSDHSLGNFPPDVTTALAGPGHVVPDGGLPPGANSSGGGKKMTYEVRYVDGTVEEVEAKTKGEARRMAKDVYGAPIDEIIEVDEDDEDDDDDDDEDEDPNDWDDDDESNDDEG